MGCKGAGWQPEGELVNPLELEKDTLGQNTQNRDLGPDISPTARITIVRGDYSEARVLRDRDESVPVWMSGEMPPRWSNETTRSPPSTALSQASSCSFSTVAAGYRGGIVNISTTASSTVSQVTPRPWQSEWVSAILDLNLDVPGLVAQDQGPLACLLFLGRRKALWRPKVGPRALEDLPPVVITPTTTTLTSFRLRYGGLDADDRAELSGTSLDAADGGTSEVAEEFNGSSSEDERVVAPIIHSAKPRWLLWEKTSKSTPLHHPSTQPFTHFSTLTNLSHSWTSLTAGLSN